MEKSGRGASHWRGHTSSRSISTRLAVAAWASSAHVRGDSRLVPAVIMIATSEFVARRTISDTSRRLYEARWTWQSFSIRALLFAPSRESPEVPTDRPSQCNDSLPMCNVTRSLAGYRQKRAP